MRRQRWGLVWLAVLLALASPAWTGSVRCTTHEEKTLGQLYTVCDDGTRAVSTYHKTLQRWESTVTTPPSSNRSKRPLQPKAPRR